MGAVVPVARHSPGFAPIFESSHKLCTDNLQLWLIGYFLVTINDLLPTVKLNVVSSVKQLEIVTAQEV